MPVGVASQLSANYEVWWFGFEDSEGYIQVIVINLKKPTATMDSMSDWTQLCHISSKTLLRV